VARVPAAKVEATIVDTVRRHIGLDAPSDDTDLINTCIRRIEVRRSEITISLTREDRGRIDAIATSLFPKAHQRPKPSQFAPIPETSSSPRSRAEEVGQVR
jgi:hypothetical protein